MYVEEEVQNVNTMSVECSQYRHRIQVYNKNDELAMSYCGTPEYLAPEMISHAGHDKTVDWWAVGILVYEMLIGVTPFFNRNRQVLMSKIKHSKIVFPDRKTYKIAYSDEIVDVISKLLRKDKGTRLGAKQDA